MKNKLGILEQSFAIVALSFFSGSMGLIPGFILTLIRYSIVLISILIICLHRKDALRKAYSDKLFWLFTAIVLLSFLWSDVYLETLKNNREVFYMTVFGLYFATRFSLKEQVKTVANTFFIGALASVIVALALPSVGIHGADHPGAWKGVYDYKNTFGSMMIIGSLAFFCLPLNHPLDRLYKWVGILLLLTMVLLCTSKSSLVIYFLSILILAFYSKFRWRGKISVVFLDIGILVAACIGTLVISQWVSLLSSLGKDPTLTGRTVLWSTALLKLESRPFLGFGRSAFWSSQLSNGHEVGFAVAAGFVAPHAHNGFLDVALDVGFVGVSLFLLVYFRAFFRALKLAYATKKTEEIWPLAFLIFLAMNNMTESYMLRLANVYWVLFTTVVLYLNNDVFLNRRKELTSKD